MEQYSLEELLTGANEHFDNLQIDKLYATGDGQYFVSENRALLHATPNKLRVFTLVKGDQPAVIDSEDDANAEEQEDERAEKPKKKGSKKKK